MRTPSSTLFEKAGSREVRGSYNCLCQLMLTSDRQIELGMKVRAVDHTRSLPSLVSNRGYDPIESMIRSDDYDAATVLGCGVVSSLLIILDRVIAYSAIMRTFHAKFYLAIAHYQLTRLLL